jgi:hypothetical protein
MVAAHGRQKYAAPVGYDGDLGGVALAFTDAFKF